LSLVRAASLPVTPSSLLCSIAACWLVSNEHAGAVSVSFTMTHKLARALVSVSDKTGLTELCSVLVEKYKVRLGVASPGC
jgi:hypothetical protein